MTYSKLFTVVAAIVGSIWANYALAVPTSFKYDLQTINDTLLALGDTTELSPEELALLVEYIPNEPNEVIQDRLSCIESEIPLTFNPFVRNFIDYFTIRNRKYSRTMLSRQNVYFPLFEKYLKKYDMPEEMKYLAIVESGLNPKAASWAKAVGLWQFIPTTGKEYGLDQSNYIDERMDPEKATDAACRFLKRLHKTYGDWELAMAAYNCGPGNVNKAIRRAGGGQKTFWEIFPYLPKETRSYVPSMTAVIYTMNYAPQHNIFTDSVLYAHDVETITINQAIDLEKLAEEMHLDSKTLLALNPEIKKSVLPANTRNYKLRVPAERSQLIASAADLSCMIAAASPVAPEPKPIQEREPAQAPVLLASTTPAPAPAATTLTDTTEKKFYTVQRGDNLSSIATKHNVTVEQLKDWNNLRKSTIMANQKLTVYQPKMTEAIAMVTPAEEAEAKPIVAQKAAKPALKISEKQQEVVHQVQPGDTLWTISQKYNGISVEQIKKLNKLKSNQIKPGQKLILG
ncbi:LysM peptidoglycan-binding domain-containing protein [Pontibacter sp. BT310]|uniref:LysM peptidoglycan-binding domain-containing protein n=1 Tax=Pontibacter populi TaxID=890055 RepID=A0ABS6XH25_9BACT|nr:MULTISPECIES: lytic transglycosylase domain-containing protein [Pontibacter]MBJ6119573.1 LysM peptidoglycan-binding domain-containing protein [Pontibacter sp. BT310]MBR0572000.1 LysM peptidoglycan-binding domain-containing protein [Microvirga sp. STS03]MBW3366426.1 LysM peptidoglycan-binding domain-containing protein [Pontibacter populi]